eukprot:Seg152.8 transcript_id=Seg152.8/GoldUCD/mRNA.D3Y31 product="Globin-2 A chain" protein_id=Seg152.8/GoldUCD/D3Y31
MGILASRTIVKQEVIKTTVQPITFPVSTYHKYLLKSNWKQIEHKQLEFGVGLFQRLFRLRPDLVGKFTEFEDPKEIENLKTWTMLKGHPRKLAYAFNLAIDSLDDGLLFIEKIESIGHKHIDKMSDADMEVMGEAVIGTVRELTPSGCWSLDVENAWQSLYGYICKLFKDSIQKARPKLTVSDRSLSQ